MPARPDIARSVEAGMNGVVEYQPSALHQFAPKYKVYIFNVGPLSWTIDPISKIDNRIARGSAGSYAIEACPAGKAYSKPLVLPSIVMSSYIDAGTGAMKTDDVEGKYVAQDIVNPNNGGDWSEGVNLTERGVFWTFNEVPTEQELADARAKLEVYLRKMLAAANDLETRGQINAITPNMRLAATYFKEDRKWNPMFNRVGSCPICGDQMRENTIKHSCGYVVDPEAAYKAGVITLKEQNDLLRRRGIAVQDTE